MFVYIQRRILCLTQSDWFLNIFISSYWFHSWPNFDIQFWANILAVTFPNRTTWFYPTKQNLKYNHKQHIIRSKVSFHFLQIIVWSDETTCDTRNYVSLKQIQVKQKGIPNLRVYICVRTHKCMDGHSEIRIMRVLRHVSKNNYRIPVLRGKANFRTTAVCLPRKWKQTTTRRGALPEGKTAIWPAWCFEWKWILIFVPPRERERKRQALSSSRSLFPTERTGRTAKAATGKTLKQQADRRRRRTRPSRRSSSSAGSLRNSVKEILCPRLQQPRFCSSRTGNPPLPRPADCPSRCYVRESVGTWW